MEKMKLITLCYFLLAFSVSTNANMLLNPGFEAGVLTSWQSLGNASIRTADPLAYEGQNYIYGESTALFRIWQDVNLADQGVSLTDIDAGVLDLEFGGWQSGCNSQTDNGQIVIHLLDANMTEIGIDSLPSFFSNHTWVEQSATTALLENTRFVRYEFIGTRTGGSNNDAYLDAAFLNVAPVPIPAAFLLFGSGIIGLLCTRTKQKLHIMFT
jgi:hypothetical protein